jgi:hypothetical protein
VPDPRCNPYIELITFLPSGWPIGKPELGERDFYWPIKLIKDLGRFPNTHATWLGFGHTVPEPKDSYLYEKGFEATILLKSKTIDEEFQRVEFDGGAIDILMPFPITGKELAFKKEKGIMAFAELYARYEGDDLISTMRDSFLE